MGWPTLTPALVADDRVTIRRAGTWTQDASGGKVRNLGPSSSPWPCTISPVGRMALHVQPSNRRDTMVGRYTVTFANVNPQLHKNDELTWLEENRVLIVINFETAGSADARLWIAYAEEHAIL